MIPPEPPPAAPAASAADSAEVARRLETALDIARDTAARLRDHFRRGPARIDTKRDGSAVTEADHEAETAICRAIEAAFPDDGRLGEEFGEVPGRSGLRWVIDPIDGTESFIRGVPLFGTLIGIERAGRPVAGVMAMPALDEIVWGGSGLGAWRSLEGATAPAQVSQTARLDEAMLCTTGAEYFRAGGQLSVFTRLASACGKMRGWSDCYAYTLLATGRCDVVVEPGVHWWDIAAPIAIVEAAGGQFTDWLARPLEASNLLATLASNSALHALAAEAIRAPD